MPYLLPSDKTPTSFRCVQIEIPDDADWYRAFWGALYDLAHWTSFERDEDKNATVVARVWRDIIDTAYQNFADSKECGGTMKSVANVALDPDCKLLITYTDDSPPQLIDIVPCLPPGPTGPPGADGQDCDCQDNPDDTSNSVDIDIPASQLDPDCAAATALSKHVLSLYIQAVEAVHAGQETGAIISVVAGLLIGGPIGLIIGLAGAAINTIQNSSTSTLLSYLTGTHYDDLLEHMICCAYGSFPANYKIDRAWLSAWSDCIITSANPNAVQSRLGDFIGGLGAKELYEAMRLSMWNQNVDCTCGMWIHTEDFTVDMNSWNIADAGLLTGGLGAWSVGTGMVSEYQCSDTFCSGGIVMWRNVTQVNGIVARIKLEYEYTAGTYNGGGEGGIRFFDEINCAGNHVEWLYDPPLPNDNEWLYVQQLNFRSFSVNLYRCANPTPGTDDGVLVLKKIHIAGYGENPFIGEL